MNPPRLPARLAVVGTGLIGGSVGLAARVAGVAEVSGVDVRAGAAREALRRGAVTRTARTVPAAVAGADLVVLATPARATAELVRLAAEAAPPAAVLTDVASTKGYLLRDLTPQPGVPARFVPGHPMAGSAEQGVAAARADLFAGAVWALTPHPDLDPRALRTVSLFVRALGARPLVIDPAVHDRVVAFASHLPQLVATALMDTVARAETPAALGRLAAAGFRDTTRVAASDPRVWADVCATNRDAVLLALDAYLERLTRLRGLVSAEDDAGLLELLGRARRARRRLPARPGAPRGLTRLRVHVADRPGSLAAVTALLSTAGINVEDLAIDHEPARRAGVLSVWVARRSAPAARATLEAAGWRVAG